MKSLKMLAILFPILSASSFAQFVTPHHPMGTWPDPMITYQGFLTDTKGMAPIDTFLVITFSLYNDSAGGTPVWTEVHQNVEVKNGLFSVILGRTSNIDPLIFLPQSYLGIKIGNEPELLPRLPLTGTLYAMKAGTATRADTADFVKIHNPDSGVVKNVNGLFGSIVLKGDGKIAVTSIGDSILLIGCPGCIKPKFQSHDGSISSTDTGTIIVDLSVASSGIGTSHIKDGAVTAAKLAPGIPTQHTILASSDGSISIGVDPDPYRPDISLAQNAVGTTHIKDGSVTSSKIALGTFGLSSPDGTISIFDPDPWHPAISLAQNAVGTNHLKDNAVTAPKIASNQVVKSLNGLKDAVTIKPGQGITVNASGSDVTIGLTASTDTGQFLKAWGRITAAGTLASGYGISSVTYNALDTTYTINFAKPFTSWTSYAPMVTPIATEYCELGVVQPMTASSCRVTLFLLSGTPLTKRKYADDFSIGVPGLP